MNQILVAGMMSVVIGGDAVAQARSGTIDITITVPSADSAHVEQRYVLTASPVELRLLTRPCAAIENLRIERGGTALGFVPSNDGPWVTLRDTTPGDSLPLIVRYDVRRTGTAIIPLVHPATPLARSNVAPSGAVSVSVTFAGNSRRVAFPHMTRQAQNQWAARYVGVPSFVEIAGEPVEKCSEPAVRGDNGGLVWRFFLLLGIMVAWVPLYLAWARRSGESA